MSDFLRPEARAALWRWREVIIAATVIALGLWWAIGSFGIVRWIGIVIVIAGVILALAGIQQGRFRQTGDGPGVVQVTERRLAYFGPLSGGTMDIDNLFRLELDPQAIPSPNWVLTERGGHQLYIPVNAIGADGLFDLFGALPNLETEAMLAVLTRTPDARVTIWEQTPDLLH